MYSVSEHYKNAIKNSNPSYLTGLITFKDGSTRELTMADIAIGGPSITMQAVTQDVLEFGAAVLGQLDISIITNKNESRYKYYDGIVTLDFNIETTGGVETIPLGEFIITEAERNKNALDLCAYDNLFKLDKSYALSLIGTPYDLMSVIADDCGCELAEDEDYYKSLPNGSEALAINTNSSCNTYRQAASIVAQMCGCFVQADRYGKISFRQFSTTETLSLDMSQRYHSTIADYVCKYVDLLVTGLAGSFRAVSETVDTGMTMYMEDAPAWDYGVEAVLQGRADNLIAYLDNLQYTPCELSIISDPSIDCGDRITLQTDTGTVDTLVTSYTWTFHAPMELMSAGKNPYLISNDAAKQRVIRDFEVNGGGGSPSILYSFKNLRRFKCATQLEPVVTTSFVAAKDTFVLFSGTLQINVEVDDVTHTSSITVLDSDGTSKTYEVPYTRGGYVNVYLQYYFNGNALIEPYQLTLEQGSHVVTLHYPINDITEGSVNRFEVRMSADGGTVVVEKEKFIGTITGQGLAGKPTWDGTITVEEPVGKIIDISKATIKVLGFTAEVSPKTRIPTARANIEAFGKVALSTGITVLGLNAELGVNRIITNYTFETNKASIYDFNKELVSHIDKFKLRHDYSYTSNEIDIDTGKMCSVKIITDDKTSIESVEITDYIGKVKD